MRRVVFIGAPISREQIAAWLAEGYTHVSYHGGLWNLSRLISITRAR